jgi:cytochrome c-type biogenesis protein CcmH
MTGFWILAAFLLLGGYAFFIPALFKTSRQTATDRQRLNLLLHAQRREELMREARREDLEHLTVELDKDLLGDLAASEKVTGTASTGGRRPLMAALVALPAIAVLLYSQLGRLDLVGYSPDPTSTRSGQMGKDIQEAIDQLAERLKNNPSDLEGWMLLGRSLGITQQFDKAARAYEFALKLAPDNLDTQALYAQTLAETNQGRLQGKPSEIVAAILRKDPKHPNALWLAGLAAAQDGDTGGAVANWEKLKAQFPAESEEAKQLSAYIAEVQAQSAPTQAQQPEQPAVSAQQPKSIRVKVTLAEALRSRAAPGDTVFIFARAASGPPMPLAIVRKQVKDLPIEVTLDDSMAMVQGMNLSAFDRLVIGARVSKSGTAMPSPGDLQGMTEPTAAENGATYSVQIGQEVR